MITSRTAVYRSEPTQLDEIDNPEIAELRARMDEVGISTLGFHTTIAHGVVKTQRTIICIDGQSMYWPSRHTLDLRRGRDKAIRKIQQTILALDLTATVEEHGRWPEAVQFVPGASYCGDRRMVGAEEFTPEAYGLPRSPLFPRRY